MYKRQAQPDAKFDIVGSDIDPDCVQLSIENARKAGVANTAVSYTHLDVYKRQTPGNARAVRMAQQAGVQIVLCTGRNVREVRRFSEQLERCV